MSGKPLQPDANSGDDARPEELRLDRETLVRETIEKMRSEKRRGYRSALDELDDECLVVIAMMHLKSAKIGDIHAALCEIVGAEKATNEQVISRWLSRFTHCYGLLRATERTRLARTMSRLTSQDDLQETALLANRMLADAVVNTMSDKADLTELSAAQQMAIVSAIGTFTKAGFDEKITAAKLRREELRSQRLEQDIQKVNLLLENQQRAAAQAREELEKKAVTGADGARHVDAVFVSQVLDRVLRGEAA